ncbi:MAG TPA: chemotaxis protein CheW [Magnetospirillum sp.]|nr:chemotaxis protein CheW [Magnetospirillum sp.]
MSQWSGHRTLEVVTLGLDGEVFAIDAGIVREILDIVPVTRVPGANPLVGGLINVRGKVVPLADPRVRLGMQIRPPTIDSRILVIEAELKSGPGIVGLLADKVYEVTEVAASALEETPRLGMRWPPHLIRCIGKRNDDFVIVLEIGRLFSTNEPPVSVNAGESKNDSASA